ncbi:hypothetical protein IQ266_08490 [filamentous cyanobacterium LEGE 11480]|uniref:Uncharacterized protein n=1 Tax=Romeriopsis navalis LEGE 11480 TaxID=2777977 RepID=A0A928Z3Y2_9CYAN|nr:hypothetical protein [Romeriopsis navalis]MBE9029763.1 hypothetical protein [Romeriopsis navalis LEGE 11480]
MNFLRRFSLPALMLTTLAASAMSVAVAPQSAEAFIIRRKDADVFNNKYARKHYVRGKCSIAKGKLFIPVPTGVLFGRQIPVGGEVRCSADVFKRKAAVIRLRRTRKLNVKRYFVVEGRDDLKIIASKTSKTCNGKRCVIKLKPSRSSKVVGMTACIESRGKSRIVQIGTVPTGLDNGFKSKRCSARKY